jgi:NADPH-dependent curcumin reductase CurA
MEGQTIGQVIRSRNPSLPAGTFVVTNYGWREYFTFSGMPDGFTLTVLDKPVSPLQAHLHAVSLYGASAYFHVTDCAKVKAGETVWISTAAGTTGSIACQIARMEGAKVIGTTSSDAKVAWLKSELGLDAAFNYQDPKLLQSMKAAFPEGIDVYIDYAGGRQLEIALDLMKPHGRIIKVGDTCTYDGATPVGPSNMFQLVLKRASILGCSVFDYLAPPDRLVAALGQLAQWYAAGKIKVAETVYHGIENGVQAQLDLFRGKNTGKMLVKLGEPEAL